MQGENKEDSDIEVEPERLQYKVTQTNHSYKETQRNCM